MIRFCVLAVLIFLITILWPVQACLQSRADSLRKALEEARGKERIEILLELGGYTRQADVKNAIAEAQQAIEISRRL